MAAAPAPQAATARPPKGWLATLVVAALMLLIVGSGVAVQDAVADQPALGIKVGTGVYLYPADGWEFAGRSDDDPTTILLTNGGGSMAVGIDPDESILVMPEIDEFLKMRDDWLATGTVTASDPEPVTVGPFVGRRFSYTGTFEDVPIPVEGEVTSIADVVFDGWAGLGQYGTVRGDVDEMIRTAEINPQ